MKQKPSDERTPEQVLEFCITYGHAHICGGQVLVIRRLLKKTGWSLVKHR